MKPAFLLPVGFLLIIGGCKTTDGTYSPLLKQTLYARPGHAGLTHSYCKTIGPFGDCQGNGIIDYPSTKEFSEHLEEMHFVCSLNGKRYYPCFKDSFGVCRNSFSGWGPWKKIKTEFQPYDVDKFVDGKLKCASKKR